LFSITHSAPIAASVISARDGWRAAQRSEKDRGEVPKTLGGLYLQYDPEPAIAQIVDGGYQVLYVPWSTGKRHLDQLGIPARGCNRG
jgi:hypothetical protein